MKRTIVKILSITLVLCLLSVLVQAAAFAQATSAPLLANQTYDFKNVYTGAGGGFIVDVIFHPKQQNLIYAKTDMGGVYRWEQSSGTWTQLMNWVTAENWNWTGGESVAVDPSDPNRLYIAGGTYTNNWSPDNGVILRSTDKGNTFQVTQMPFKMGGNMPGRGMGERLAVDPNKGSILFFGARDGAGLWKSSDYGVTWSKVTNFPVTGVYAEDPNDTQYDYNNHPVGIPWVIFDPATGTPGNATQTIYVGVADGRSGQPNVYRSTNGGLTWEAIPGQPTCTASSNIVTCTGGVTWDKTALGDDGLPATPKDSLLAKQGAVDSQGTLYITYSSWAGPYRGNYGDVWKFTPGTGTWTQITPANTANGNCIAGIEPYWGYGGLGLDMQEPGTLVVAAVNSWWPDGQLFRTTDGGTTWKCLWEYQSPIAGWPPTVIKHFSLDLTSAPWIAHGNPVKDAPEASVKLGWMMEGLKIDPFNSNRMMYGTGETLYGTTNLNVWDTGGTVVISSMAKGMEQTSVLGLVSPPSGTAHLFSAVGDIGGWRHDNLDAAPAMAAGYTIPDSGTVTSIDYAELTPSFLVRVGSNAAFTYDSGGNWFQGNSDPGNYGTVAAAANGSRVLWAPENGPVSWSSDNGSAWNASANIPQKSAIASDRVNPVRFYGLGGNKFWVSTDGGATFTASAATGMPESGEVKAVFGREGDVWVAGGAQISGGSSTCTICGLWHSTNSGASFTKLANVEDANAIGFGMAKPGGSGYPAIFLAGKVDGVRAIFRSDDMGANWVNITDAGHQYATIQTITGDPRVYGRVYFGTNGLGIVYGDISGVQDPTPTITPTACPSVNVTGRITDQVTGQGIAGAIITANLSVSHPFSATSRADGNYTLSVPNTSGYACLITGLSISATGYEGRGVTASSAQLIAQPVRNFALSPTTTVTPTYTPTGPTNTPTRTPTITPTPGGNLKVQVTASGTDNNQQTGFRVRVQNTGTSARSNISVRLYFTTDGSNAASNYTLEKYYDQSGVATVSGPTQVSGDNYYFTINYGTASLSAGGAWEYHTSMHLKNWSSTYNATNDWWHGTGTLPASYTDRTTIPAYQNGTKVWGDEPGTDGNLPDLVPYAFMIYSYPLPTRTPPAQGCYLPVRDYGLGVQVTVRNLGTLAAGPFVVDVNGQQQTVNGLAAGESTAVRFPQFISPNIIKVDATSLIAESDESNNNVTWHVPVLSATPTGSPPPTICVASVTPTHTPSLTPSPTVTRTVAPPVLVEGHVRLGNASGPGVPGVNLSIWFGGPHGQVTTDADGYYQVILPRPLNQETVSVVPQLSGYTFSPTRYDWILLSYDTGPYTRNFIAAEGPTPTHTVTPTMTPTQVPGACSPVIATITAPFTRDGAGTFCWQTSNLGTYINSWGLASLTINGVDFTSKYASSSSYPPKINGYWYVSYTGNFSWSHFEAK